VKSSKPYNNYSGFSKGTPERKATAWTCDCQTVRLFTYQTRLRSVFKMSSVCLNASSKTWAPLPDRFIDERLLEMFPVFDQTQLQLVDVMNPAVVDTLLQLPPSLIVNRAEVRTVGWPQSWSDEVCGFFSLSVAWTHARWTGALFCCNSVFNTDSVHCLFGISAMNFLPPYPSSCLNTLNKYYPHNFILIRSDLTFLLYIV